LNPPIVFSSTYHAGGPIGYGRYGNESWSALESAISELEGGQTLSFSSGMAAISAVFSILPIGAPVVASNQGYSGTMGLLNQHHASGRLEVRFVDITNTEEVIGAMKGAALLWLESPTNPCLDIADLAALISAAKKQNIGVGVDNTFATPLVQKPLSMGADIVMHSVTKFLAGHSDVVLGSLSIADPALYKRLEESRRFNGAIPGPFEAWLALRGIRTFPVRFRAAEANAKTLVTRLQNHAKITKVRYPGFGAVISFEIDGNAENAEKVCESSRLIAHATSLGGVESLWERRRRWALESPSVPEQLIRLSVGCEHVDDIWQDIEQALASL
jgi:cystathionine gamma-synthase